ncbi:hypothetical protein [Egicoccus halophilus]|uniref:Uncharacterized protein n=1 Tax=Egicoccus halophilus TaxID=1670830 RepID=A0A8J3EUQ5_9ACTN|nr:hypothetical protein [Egicoccus halophilus]GGI07660.1 hypothetical protein GCM10011354_25200 [Egicoccus halophilus]
MKTEFRNRVFLPIVLPLAILGCMALFIGAVAAILLFNTHEGALAIAAVAAAGILLTVSLATSQERLDTPRRAVVAFAAVVPFALGGAYAAGLLGDIADEDRNINAEPLLVVPDDAPIIAAENSLDFCIPTDAGCEDADLWEVTPSEQGETLVFVFDNRESGVQHNVVITELEGDVDDPAPTGEEFVSSTLVSGPVLDPYVDDELRWEDLPEQWFFYCEIHPNMNGVGTVVAEG